MEKDEFEAQWEAALNKIASRAGGDVDLQGALFLIGLNELGKGPMKLSKDQKVDVIHIAVCQLLAPFGYYEFVGEDKDGWPHYERTKKMPHLGAKDQERIIKEAIVTYTQEW